MSLLDVLNNLPIMASLAVLLSVAVYISTPDIKLDHNISFVQMVFWCLCVLADLFILYWIGQNLLPQALENFPRKLFAIGYIILGLIAIKKSTPWAFIGAYFGIGFGLAMLPLVAIAALVNGEAIQFRDVIGALHVVIQFASFLLILFPFLFGDSTRQD